MAGYVVNLNDYMPPARFDGKHWTQAQIAYSPDNVQGYALLATIALTPADADPADPTLRSFTVTNAPSASGWLVVTFFDADGNQAPTDAVPYPVPTGHGSASPSIVSARYAVRHRIRDGVPLLDADPVPFNMVRLEDLSDQVPNVPTPSQTVFQCRYTDVPTQRYMNAQVVPGTLVAYLDGGWVPIRPTADVDRNGNFTLPSSPLAELRITYAWQYLADGEIDQFLDESRQWLREFATIGAIPDGLVPALVSYASHRALVALQRSSTLARVRAGDLDVDWSALAKMYQGEADAALKLAVSEREVYYSQGPEAKDPSAISISAPFIDPYTPLR